MINFWVSTDASGQRIAQIIHDDDRGVTDFGEPEHLGDPMPLAVAYRILGVDPKAIGPGDECSTCGGILVRARAYPLHTIAYCAKKHRTRITRVNSHVSRTRKAAQL